MNASARNRMSIKTHLLRCLPRPLLAAYGASTPQSDLVRRLAFGIFLNILIVTFLNLIPTTSIALPKQGPKARVAVSQFGTTDRFASVYGGWNIGGGLSAQLVTLLIESERAVVVERAILSKVLIEQELGQANLSSPFTQTPAGQLLGVDYLIVGEVTEFEERQAGIGGGVSIAKTFGPKVTSDFVAAHVGLDLRVVDTRTGEILHSHRAEGRAWERASSLKIDYKFIEFGGDLFYKTPLGKATRNAISDALQFILEVVEKRTEEFSWMARVIEVDQDVLYIDAGKKTDIQIGDHLKVSSVQKVLTDPETNEILGLVERELGQAEAIEVALKYTKAKILRAFRPRIGDLVRLVEKHKADKASVSLTGYQLLE